MLYDPATVEACAKVAEGTAPIARGNFFKARREQTAKIASAIRSLTAGREIQSSDGGAKVASSAVLASEEDQRSGLHGVMPVGTIAASSGNTDAGPSEAIPNGYADYTPVTVRAHTVPNSAGDARTTHLQGEGEPVVKQVPSPAGTVSALNSQYAGLEALLAAIHADDPKRELLVRVGDLMRENRALLSQFDVRRK